MRINIFFSFGRDIVFSSVIGHNTSVLGMESLAWSNIVEHEVIDCWTAILNFEEDRKSYNKPLRLFCNTQMTVRKKCVNVNIILYNI